MLETRKIRQFVAVGEMLHFGKAAARLNMSQPALTMAIRQLEMELGATLFDRDRRSVRLTTAGEVLLASSYSILGLLDHAKETVRSASDGTAGVLRVSFVPTGAFKFLPETMHAFREIYPRVRLDLSEGTTEQVFDDLLSARADIGFVRNMSTSAADLGSFVVDEKPMVAALPRGHRLSSKAKIDLQELAGEDFIVGHAIRLPGFRRQVVEACILRGFQPRIRHQAVAVSTMIGLVAAGMGVALLPGDAEELGHSRVVYRKVQDPGRYGLHLRLIAVWRSPLTSRVLMNFLHHIGASQDRK